MLKELVEKRKQLADKQKALAEYLASAKKDGAYNPLETIKVSSVKFAEEVQSKNKELNDIGMEIETLAGIETAEADQRRRDLEIKAHPSTHPDDGQTKEKKEFSSLSERFIKSAAYANGAYKTAGMGPRVTIGDENDSEQLGIKELYWMGRKSLFREAAGFAPESLRSGFLDLSIQRPVQILDLIPSSPISQPLYKYMRETTFTNNAGAVSEGQAATWGESALAYTEVSDEVERIAVYLPVTDEQLEDVQEARTLIDSRLTFMVMQKLDTDVVTGNGTTPNLVGVLNATNLQTQARGSDVDLDAWEKAIVKVRVTGRASPSGIVMHSNNWSFLRRLRTADGIYILGSPTDSNGVARIWGLPVAANEALTAGTGVVGDFANYSGLKERRGIDIQVGYHTTQFIQGQKSIRADIRAAMVWTRGQAFCTVTGLQS